MSTCIALATDQNYVKQTCVTIASYALSNPLNRCDIFVLIHKVDTHGVELLQTTASVFGLNLKLITVDLKWTSQLPESFRAGNAHVSPMTYSKLIALEYIPQVYTSCLMIDSDLIIVQNIDSLLAISLSECAIAAVPDFMMPESNGSRLGLEIPNSYFNSGVLLLDIKNWKDRAPLSNLSTIIKNYSSRICLGEQDILNLIFQNAYFSLEYYYNHMIMVNLDGVIPNRRLNGSSPKILHFPGQIKPWHEYAPQNLQAIYFRYASVCQWIGLGLQEPNSINEKKLAAQICKKQGNHILLQKYLASLNIVR